jgi:hypothetical protein
MSQKEIERAGNLNAEALKKVIADADAHGDYDQIKVFVYKDGTGEVRTSRGVSAPIQFEDFS